MITHKTYECEFCGEEFEADEYEKALQHENTCYCNPKHKKCGSCEYGKKIISYGVEYIQCQKLQPLNHFCKKWENKNRKKE